MRPTEKAAAEYRRGLRFVDRAFEQARHRGAVIPCRRGCSQCCAALFDVHPADALLLGAWLEAQPSRRRAEVVGRARSVLAELRARATRLAAAGERSLDGWEPSEGLRTLSGPAVARLAESVAGSRCPLLGEGGECRAHDSRPAICRLQGLPWRDPATGSTVADFCRLEAAQADNLPRELDLGRLDALRHEAGEAAKAAAATGALPPGRSFVAEVVVRWEDAIGEGEDVSRQ